MLELGIGADIVRALGLIFWLLFLVALVYALISGKNTREKTLRAGVVLLLFFGPAIPNMVRQYEVSLRFSEAKALFDTRCKSASETIFRTVTDVEGVLLLNVRTGADAGSYEDPDWVDAAMPHEPGGQGYIMTFLYWEQYEDKRNDRGYLNNKSSDLPGFRFADARLRDGKTYRYRILDADTGSTTREPIEKDFARYAVSFVNVGEPADRKHWVAGTKVTITDTFTSEVLAEKTWYAMEPGLGSRLGARAPWAFATVCPHHTGWSGGTTRFFVDRVLMPKK